MSRQKDSQLVTFYAIQWFPGGRDIHRRPLHIAKDIARKRRQSFMRAGTVAMMGAAVVFGVLALFLVQSWRNEQAGMLLNSVNSDRPQTTRKDERDDLPLPPAPGMKAVVIQISQVADASGFVLPGDQVDVVLTQNKPGSPPASNLVMKNVRLLTVDLPTGEGATKAAVPRSATLELSSSGAEAVALAAKQGSLSLLLRNVREVR